MITLQYFHLILLPVFAAVGITIIPALELQNHQPCLFNSALDQDDESKSALMNADKMGNNEVVFVFFVLLNRVTMPVKFRIHRRKGV